MMVGELHHFTDTHWFLKKNKEDIQIDGNVNVRDALFQEKFFINFIMENYDVTEIVKEFVLNIFVNLFFKLANNSLSDVGMSEQFFRHYSLLHKS